MAALPTMRTELLLSSAGVQWAVNAYLVVSAAFIVLGGQAADRFGPRLASMAGLALFAVASCIIATAGTQAALLAGRALQGLAAAFAVPSTLAAVDTSAAPERRAAAIGAWTGFLMPASALARCRRRAHSRHRLARDLLAQRPAHVHRRCRSGRRGLGGRACLRYAKPARGLDRLCFAGHVDGVAGLRAACIAPCGAAPLPVVGPFVLAATAFFLLLSVELRAEAPLVDLSFFARRGFVMGLASARCRCSAS